MTVDEWMTSKAAAARLHVKVETLYAYVSRGMLRSERIPGTRRSRFFRPDIERLAAGRRGGGKAGGLEVIIETDLTSLDPAGHVHYRGWDVTAAVTEGASFEEVASWLWNAERVHIPFDAPTPMITAARHVATTLTDQPTPDRLRAVVAAIRHSDPLRDDRRPVAVAMAARSLIATLVDVLPPAAISASSPTDASIAARLWPKLSPQPASPAAVHLLDAALVLLADHELAASTLAVRVAASTWADPYLVVQTGLAVLGGPLHGGASAGARRLIREVRTTSVSAAEAVGRRLRGDELIPGFGHRVYHDHDPRAHLLLAMLADVQPVVAETALIQTMHQRGLPFPNIDFAIAGLAERYDMVDEAGETIFAIARIAGWLAHAAEEYQHRLRFRPRAVYTGPPPSSVVPQP